jgi:non-specific serine/threonine protein kinase
LVLGEADIHRELARLSLLQGDPASALQSIRQALMERQRFEDVAGAAEDLAVLVELALLTDEPCSAAHFLGALEGLRRHPGTTPAGVPSGEAHRALTKRVRSALEPATFERCHGVGMNWSPAEAIAAALAFEPTIEPAKGTRTAANPHGLSPREVEVLRLMAAGLSNQEIADALYLSRRTVSSHASNILGKIGLSTRTQAVAYAIRNGIA